VTSTAAEPSLPPADETLVRAHADVLAQLAGRYGVSNLRFASAGRLVGHVDDSHDALDVAEFELAARVLLGAEIGLFSTAVLSKPNVSPDLVAARPL
jgi:hypothetical protein